MATVSALDVQVTEGSQHPELGEFLSTLGGIGKALGDVDQAAAPGEDVRRPRWVVQDLTRQGKQFRVQITALAVPDRDRADLTRPVSLLIAGVRDLRREPEVPEFYSERTVEKLLALGKTRKGIAEVSLAPINGITGPFEALDAAVMDNARAAVSAAQHSIGSITGTLTGLKRTSRGLRLTVLDPTAKRLVNGTAPFDMADDLRPCWNHRVVMRSRLTRNLAGQVLRFAATNVERLPDEHEHRNVTDSLWGADPTWTNGMTVDDFVAASRA